MCSLPEETQYTKLAVITDFFLKKNSLVQYITLKLRKIFLSEDQQTQQTARLGGGGLLYYNDLK